MTELILDDLVDVLQKATDEYDPKKHKSKSTDYKVVSIPFHADEYKERAMTEKEAIIQVSNAIEFSKRNKGFLGNSLNAQALSIVVNMAQKQMPKKPIGFGECPVCYQPMSTSPNYCPHCGQKLDWSAGNDNND